MKKILLICLLTLTSIITGCESSSYNVASFRIAETQDVVVSAPLVVEYDTIYQERVYDTCTFRIIDENVDYTNIKRAAVLQCSKRYHCDIIVNPSYDISRSSNEVTVIVSGFPARYSRIRPATPDDLWMLRFKE